MYTLLRLTLLLLVPGLTGCALFVPEPDVIDVVAPTTVPTTIATRVILGGTPTQVTSPTAPGEVRDTPTGLATATIRPEVAAPISTQLALPSSTPTLSTPTPITAIFLTPTEEWQPVQVGRAIFEIPRGWLSMPLPPGAGNDEAFFQSVDLSVIPPGTYMDEGYARIEHGQASPDPNHEEWTAVMVDGYDADYKIARDDNFEAPLWFGVLHIHTPGRRHQFGLRCSAPGYLGEVPQREFLAFCDSLMQHWIETTRILD